MESENNSGGSGRCSSYVPPRCLERKNVTASATGNEKKWHYSSQTDMAAGSSQLVREKRCRDNEGFPNGCAEDEGDGPGNHQATELLTKAVEEDVQQLCQAVNFTHQASGLLKAEKASFLDSSTAFEEGIMQLHQNVLET